MQPIHLLSSDSLEFHEQDAYAAVSANPRNPKATQYLAEAHACRAEIDRRAKLQRMRARAQFLFDPLTVSLRKRRLISQAAWRRNESRDAARAAAYLRAVAPRP